MFATRQDAERSVSTRDVRGGERTEASGDSVRHVSNRRDERLGGIVVRVDQRAQVEAAAVPVREDLPVSPDVGGTGVRWPRAIFEN